MIKVHEEAYFIIDGRCKNLIMLIDMCEARNQMWQCKKAKRDRFIEKTIPYVKTRISNIVRNLGYTRWKLERTGSDILSDVVNMRHQSFRVMLYNKRDSFDE
jgi:hypothetical protein